MGGGREDTPKRENKSHCQERRYAPPHTQKKRGEIYTSQIGKAREDVPYAKKENKSRTREEICPEIHRKREKRDIPIKN